jgi:DnaA family protein
MGALVQLVLPIHQQNEFTFKNFISGDNSEAVKHLKRLLESPSPRTSSKPLTLIQGASGTGKTHMLLAVAHLAQSHRLEHQYLDINSLIKMPAEVLNNLGMFDVLCIDNVDSVAGDSQWQEHLFDLINQFLERDGRALIMSTSKRPQSSDYTLPDLVSRLIWGTVFSLKELSETDKIKAIECHMEARGLHVQHEAVAYLMKRTARDMHMLMHIVEQLDKLSLQNQRKLTIPFIKDALNL